MEADWVSKTDIEKRTPDNERRTPSSSSFGFKSTVSRGKAATKSRTSRDGLLLARDGLLARVPKHGVFWKGEYKDGGVFAA